MGNIEEKGISGDAKGALLEAFRAGEIEVPERFLSQAG